MSGEFQSWVGREEERREPLQASVARAMAATMDLASVATARDPLPPGWHWLFFNPVVRQSQLGLDGHPARGGFLPPIDAPRRMWAGVRIQYLADMPIGAEATRRSKVLKVVEKAGKRGSLWFVTVEHRLICEGALCLTEEQDIVYCDRPPPERGGFPRERYDEVATWSESITPGATLLFRYAALTFNGHRIHYDQTYAREEEGYPDLVVQGPLTATLLQAFAVRHGGGRPLATFSYRGVTPLFVGRPFQLEGRPETDGGALSLWARGPDGELAATAQARFR